MELKEHIEKLRELRNEASSYEAEPEFQDLLFKWVKQYIEFEAGKPQIYRSSYVPNSIEYLECHGFDIGIEDENIVVSWNYHQEDSFYIPLNWIFTPQSWEDYKALVLKKIAEYSTTEEERTRSQELKELKRLQEKYLES